MAAHRGRRQAPARRDVRVGVSDHPGGCKVNCELARSLEQHARKRLAADARASELGIGPYLEPLGGPTAAEVYIARLEEGETVREVWPQVVARTRESVVEWLAVREGETR